MDIQIYNLLIINNNRILVEQRMALLSLIDAISLLASVLQLFLVFVLLIHAGATIPLLAG